MAFKAACVQTTSGDDIAANIAKITALTREAAAQGASFVGLPENVFYMADASAPADVIPAYTTENHPGVLALRALAEESKIWILAGSVAVAGRESGKRLNRSLLIDAEGSIAACYDKIHLFDADLGKGERYAESSRMEPGGQAVIAETPWGKLGLSICYDLRFPYLYRTLAQGGAELLAVPAAFTVPTGEAHWQVLLRARAIENGCFIVAPAQCGMHPGGRRTFGHSLIVNPWGEVLVDGGSEPGVTIARIDLEEVAKARRNLPSLKHDREFTLS